jgi:hypothetical protein
MIAGGSPPELKNGRPRAPVVVLPVGDLQSCLVSTICSGSLAITGAGLGLRPSGCAGAKLSAAGAAWLVSIITRPTCCRDSLTDRHRRLRRRRHDDGIGGSPAAALPRRPAGTGSAGRGTGSTTGSRSRLDSHHDGRRRATGAAAGNRRSGGSTVAKAGCGFWRPQRRSTGEQAAVDAAVTAIAAPRHAAGMAAPSVSVIDNGAGGGHFRRAAFLAATTTATAAATAASAAGFAVLPWPSLVGRRRR